MIEIIDLTKSFGPTSVLNSIDISFSSDHTHILLGQSGCGKTTLLKLVLGVIKPDSGLIRIGNGVMEHRNQKRLAQEMGYVPQEGGLYPHLTGIENASLVARMLGWDKDRWMARTSELADLVRLDRALLKKYPKDLSGGQKQRIAIMRALMLDPNYLLMDEPLGALDPMVRSELQNELKELFARLKKTVLLVTHDVGEAATLGDQVHLMNEGRILQSGPITTLIKEPSDPFVTQFLSAQKPPPELSGI